MDGADSPMHWSICGFDAIVPIGQILKFKIADQINGSRETVQWVAREENIHVDAPGFVVTINDQCSREIFVIMCGVIHFQAQEFCVRKRDEKNYFQNMSKQKSQLFRLKSFFFLFYFRLLTVFFLIFFKQFNCLLPFSIKFRGYDKYLVRRFSLSMTLCRDCWK